MFQLRWVWARLAGSRKRYVFALFSAALLAVMALGNSLISANIMDTVFKPLQQSGETAPGSMQRLGMLVAVLIGFTLVRTGFGYFTNMSYESISQSSSTSCAGTCTRTCRSRTRPFTAPTAPAT